MTQRIGRILRPGGALCAARRDRSSVINLNGALARAVPAVGGAGRQVPPHRRRLRIGVSKTKTARLPAPFVVMIRRSGAVRQPGLLSGGGGVIGTLSGCAP